jgi:hypothetical protein
MKVQHRDVTYRREGDPLDGEQVRRAGVGLPCPHCGSGAGKACTGPMRWYEREQGMHWARYASGRAALLAELAS